MLEMKVMRLLPQGGIAAGSAPIPRIGPGEALIRVRVCGVCSSDMGVYRTGLGREEILGHEIVGIVEAIDTAATDIRPGDRVTGTMMQGYAEYVKAKVEELIPVPEGLSDAEAIVEPVCCLFNAIRRSNIQAGDRAIVIGAGYMGLYLAGLLRAHGVSQVTSIDLQPAARAEAERMGAVACAPSDDPPHASFVFEATGTQGGLNLAGNCVDANGTLCVVGYHPCVREIDMGLWAAKSLTVINAFEYDRARQLVAMRRALELLAQGKIQTAHLMTHKFLLQDVDLAFQTHLHRPEGFIKGYISLE